MKAKDIMTKDPVWLKPETSLREIARKMKQLDIGIVPIANGEKILGMVTDRDISLSLSDGKDPNTLTAKDVMHKGVIYCFENDDIKTVAHDMETKQVRRLIVLNNKTNKKLVGILSLGDLARHTHNQQLCGEVVDLVSQARV